MKVASSREQTSSGLRRWYASAGTCICGLACLATLAHPALVSTPLPRWTSLGAAAAAAAASSAAPDRRGRGLVAALAYCRGDRRMPTPRGTSVLRLNRILFDPCEIDDVEADGTAGTTIGVAADDEATTPGSSSGDAIATVTLSRDDYRTVHVAKILGLRNGEILRAGIVRDLSARSGSGSGSGNGNGDGGDRRFKLAGLLTDDATVEWLPEGKFRKPQPTANGEPPGSLRISIPHPPKSLLLSEEAETTGGGEASPPPPVSLLLALPRPLQLGRILPMVAQLGVDRLVLTAARKVPKDYFGSHLFRKPDELRKLLVEGLAQSGDVRLPEITVVRQLKVFLEDELDEMFPPGEVTRVIAHPQRRVVGVDGSGDVVSAVTNAVVGRMSDVDFAVNQKGSPRRVLVAVGPEGGWDESYELDMFTAKGFQQITLGTRVLRSDVAVVSLLALAHEMCAKPNHVDG